MALISVDLPAAPFGLPSSATIVAGGDWSTVDAKRICNRPVVGHVECRRARQQRGDKCRLFGHRAAPTVSVRSVSSAQRRRGRMRSNLVKRPRAAPSSERSATRLGATMIELRLGECWTSSGRGMAVYHLAEPAFAAVTATTTDRRPFSARRRSPPSHVSVSRYLNNQHADEARRSYLALQGRPMTAVKHRGMLCRPGLRSSPARYRSGAW